MPHPNDVTAAALARSPAPLAAWRTRTSAHAGSVRVQSPEAWHEPRPWLCWSTGNLALVSLALMDEDPLATDTLRWPAALGGMADLKRRVAAAAAEQGLAVFARLGGQTRTGVPTQWLVLGGGADLTTVVQADAHAPIAVPLALRLRALGDGIEVRWHPAGALSERGLPAALVDQVALLPDLLHAAMA